MVTQQARRGDTQSGMTDPCGVGHVTNTLASPSETRPTKSDLLGACGSEVPAYARHSELEQRAAAKSGRSHMVELNHLALVIVDQVSRAICAVSRDTLPAGRDQKQVICDDGEPDVYVRFERVFIQGRPDRATRFFSPRTCAMRRKACGEGP